MSRMTAAVATAALMFLAAGAAQAQAPAPAPAQARQPAPVRASAEVRATYDRMDALSRSVFWASEQENDPTDPVAGVKLAQALYGYGMYAEAEAAANLAKTKGDAKDPTEADMVIGMSQLAQGKASEAAATFDAVKAPSPASARVVRLWSYHAKAKATPATAAAQ
jgi:TolA-binding protein